MKARSTGNAKAIDFYAGLKLDGPLNPERKTWAQVVKEEQLPESESENKRETQTLSSRNTFDIRSIDREWLRNTLQSQNSEESKTLTNFEQLNLQSPLLAKDPEKTALLALVLKSKIEQV